MNEIVKRRKTRKRERERSEKLETKNMYIYNLCIIEHESQRTDGRMKTKRENSSKTRT